MSSVDRGVANNGSHSGTATISASVPVGSNICIVSALRGQSSADKTTLDMVSEKLCYTAAAVGTTTTTMATTTTTVPPIVEAKVVESGDPAPTTVEVAPAPVEAPAPLPVLPGRGPASNSWPASAACPSPPVAWPASSAAAGRPRDNESSPRWGCPPGGPVALRGRATFRCSASAFEDR